MSVGSFQNEFLMEFFHFLSLNRLGMICKIETVMSWPNLYEIQLFEKFSRQITQIFKVFSRANLTNKNKAEFSIKKISTSQDLPNNPWKCHIKDSFHYTRKMILPLNTSKRHFSSQEIIYIIHRISTSIRDWIWSKKAFRKIQEKSKDRKSFINLLNSNKLWGVSDGMSLT